MYAVFRETTLSLWFHVLFVFRIFSDMLLIIFFQVTVLISLLFSFQDLTKKIPDVFKDAVIQGMLEFEWDLFIEAKRKVRIHMHCISFAHSKCQADFSVKFKTFQ